METRVVLCSVPELDVNHNHTYIFENKDKQLQFFNSKATMSFNDVLYQKDNDSIKIDVTYGNTRLMASNYLYYINPDDSVIHYCFILNKKYINENTTQLFLKLDVMQTYLVNVDYYLNSCFIERQHMNPTFASGKPDLDVLNRPEDIECGEYIVKSVTNLYNFTDKGGYIVASTDKLSKRGNNTGVGDPDPEPEPPKPQPTVDGNAIVNSARKLIGKPYTWGGNYPPLGESAGTDCSGLCQWAYNDNGIRIPRTTYDQINVGNQVDGGSLQPGDLIFMNFSAPNTPEHVIMFAHYNDNGTFTAIEARDIGTYISEYTWRWQNNFVAKRYINLNSGGGSTTFNGGVSAKIFRFLKGFEAFSAYVYYDSGGVATQGYGTTKNVPEWNELPEPCSEQQASEAMFKTMKRFANNLYTQMKNDGARNIKQNQFDAFLSLSYNCGLYGATSSPMYSKFIANPNDTSIASDWKNYYISDASGTVLQGLIARRTQEANIYTNNSYEYRTIAIVGGGAISDNNGNGYIPSGCIGSV